MRLKPLALGLAIGLFWGVVLFVTTWLSFYTGYGRLFLETLAQSVYPGYSISPVGSFIGLLYGALDGFFCGVIISLIYNKFAKVGKDRG
jgi:hypothetical protein